MTIKNKSQRLAFKDFCRDLGLYNEKPTKEVQDSYMDVIIETTNRKLKIEVSARKNSKNIENLEDLAKTSSEIGKIETIEEIPGNNGDYKIILRINPDKFGINLIEILKQRIKLYEELAEKSRGLLGITKFEEYLGNWNSKDIILRKNVGKDLSELYSILKEKLNVSHEDVYADFKQENIPAARAIISFFLRNKYKDLSFPAIGKIINKNHATVILGIRKFDGLVLNQEVYTNIEKFFNESIKYYKGRLSYSK